MKNITKTTILLLGLVLLPALVFAAKATSAGADNSPNPISGDGIPNNTQDVEYGSYGTGESPNPISGDGIPNNTQDEEYGQYGSGASPNPISGDGIPNNTQDTEYGQYGGSDGAGQPQAQNRVQMQVQSLDDLSELMAQERVRVQTERSGDTGARAEVRAMNENAEVALTTLVASGALLDEARGQRMSELAEELLDNSNLALQAEVAIKERSAFRRFLFGGDDEQAQALRQLAEQNENTVRNMNQLMEDCDACDEATREMVQSQIRELQSSTDRQAEVAKGEAERRGVFGFLFGWLN